MKKLIIISISVLAILFVSCKKKGVCSCAENGVTYKVYYDDLSGAEKRVLKRGCEGKESRGEVVKVETTYPNGDTEIDTTPNDDDVNDSNCEWSRTGKDD